MKIQYMSDLHMEFQENSRYLKNNELPVTGDVLVLAGDIFYLRDKVAPLTKFWKWASENYRQVLIVPGNHEYYNDEYFVWKGMNDFRQIKFDGKLLQVDEFNRMHENCIGFIQKSVEESTAAHIVVVTHHLPTLQAVAPHHKSSVLNSAFASEYGELIANSRIDAWIYGHSHTNIDVKIGDTPIICNQMGYVFEDEHLMNGFDPARFIEI